MKLTVNGGFTIHLKRRRKKNEEVGVEYLESDTERFVPYFQPNRESDEGDEDG